MDTEADLIWVEDKCKAIAIKIFGDDGVDFTKDAEKEIANFDRFWFNKLQICMAKTQYSLTDDQTKLGRPEGFRITVRDLTVCWWKRSNIRTILI